MKTQGSTSHVSAGLLWFALLLLSWYVSDGGPVWCESMPALIQLNAKEGSKRKEAEAGLIALRENLFDTFTRILQESNDKSFNGPRHLALKQMGYWKFHEAVPVLIREVDWTVNRDTLPPFKKWPEWIVYPAAIALTDIGGRSVRALVIAELESTDDDRRTRLLSWVLSVSEGIHVAEMHINARLQGMLNVRMKRRLEKALEYVALGDAIFAP